LSQLFPVGGGGLSPEGGPRYNVADAHVVDLVQRLFSQATAGDPLGECYAQSLSMALAAYVSGTYGTPVAVEEAPVSSRGQQRLTELQARQVVAYVEDQLGSALGLLELAALVGYSPDHFARLFKGTFGMSPHRYVTSRRMARAKALLRDRSQPLTQVAQACGFSAQPHFTAVFKRHTGITPGAYRRQ
jgi:AraC family transcriptional regulator